MLPNMVLIFLLMVSGWMVQRGGFCLVAAVSRAMEKRPERLLLILAIAFVSVLVVLLFQAPLNYSPTGKALWSSLFGAIFFGIGAALNRGCFFGTLSNMARGDVHMLFTLVGMMATAACLPAGFFATLPPEQGHPSLLLGLFLLTGSLICWSRCRRNDHMWSVIRLLIPGLTFGFIYTTHIGWSLSGLLTESWHFIRHNQTINGIRIAGFSAFLTGMILYHFYYQDFILSRWSITKGIKHFAAGIIMMIGASMMGGGNDNLLFHKLPSLTLEVFLLLFIMLSSIAMTLFIFENMRQKC